MRDWIERNRGFVLVTLVNLALVGGLFFWLQRPAPSPVEIIPPEPTPVLRPDVYRLPPGSIVKDAIQAAGGATDDADLDSINLAQELHDQERLYVPSIGESDAPPPVTGAEPTPPSGEGTPSDKIDINTATAGELETLPGIGPVLAESIIQHRDANGPFMSIEDITLVSGIGDKTYDKLKDRITVGD
jgi:competence protein ComEA